MGITIFKIFIWGGISSGIRSEIMFSQWLTFAPLHDKKINILAFASSEDSDQPGHLPGLIRVIVVHSLDS